ncbi:MAG: hypothetical protein KKG60_02325 [Nanoarchaeota archaeon]|nr:hypothetical protein [Nanoarchaeota archaeon]
MVNTNELKRMNDKWKDDYFKRSGVIISDGDCKGAVEKLKGEVEGLKKEHKLGKRRKKILFWEMFALLSMFNPKINLDQSAARTLAYNFGNYRNELSEAYRVEVTPADFTFKEYSPDGDRNRVLVLASCPEKGIYRYSPLKWKNYEKNARWDEDKDFYNSREWIGEMLGFLCESGMDYYHSTGRVPKLDSNLDPYFKKIFCGMTGFDIPSDNEVRVKDWTREYNLHFLEKDGKKALLATHPWKDGVDNISDMILKGEYEIRKNTIGFTGRESNHSDLYKTLVLKER